MNWKETPGILCDKRIPMMLKGKYFMSLMRPTDLLLYALKCWAVNKRTEKDMNVAEMRMLRQLSGVTRKDRIRNELVRGSIGAASIVDEMRENTKSWFRHVTRREETESVSVVMKMNF